MKHSAAQQRSILITGCSSGIGACVAAGLRLRGYRVFATARKQQDVDRLNAEGFESLLLDLDKPESITAAVDAILEKTGGTLYALFNNGAYAQVGAVEDLPRDALRAQFETNLFGTFELTNRIIPVMRQQGFGRLIFNSSVLGFSALQIRGAYIGSKFAMEGLCDTLRLELHGTGINVSLLEPGPVISRIRANSYAPFVKHIDTANSPHRNYYSRFEERLKKDGPVSRFTLPPEAVLSKVVHALEARRPRVRYYVTFPTYLFAFLRHVLPFRAMDWVLRKAGN